MMRVRSTAVAAWDAYQTCWYALVAAVEAVMWVVYAPARWLDERIEIRRGSMADWLLTWIVYTVAAYSLLSLVAVVAFGVTPWPFR